MSYAEHGSRIFLAGRPNSGVPLIYGNYILPQKRSEGRLKLYDSCTDIRAWSPNALESLHYFRELNEHASTPGKVVPFDAVMESMIGLTAQAQNELRVAQRELQKYKSLKLTPEQRKYLENLNKGTVEIREMREPKVESIIKPLSWETLLNANKLVSSQHSDTHLSIYLRPDKRFQYNREVYNSLLANMRISREDQNTNLLLENNSYLVSRVTSCGIITEMKAMRECSIQVNARIVEHIDASCQTVQDVREAIVQTDAERKKDIDDYDNQANVDSSSSQYYDSNESASTSESELGVNSDREECDKSHKGVIIRKDSEIISLKYELELKEEELEELRKLNKELQELYKAEIKEKDENANILRRNLNALQEKLKIVSTKRNDEAEDLNAKLACSECLVDQLKAELGRKCQVCHLQSQDIQELRKQVKETELLSIENESLTRKVKEMEHLSQEAESCGIALEQVKNVWRERDMLQEQYREQSCTLADREDEIKRLLTLIEQNSVTADTREVEMNHILAVLRNEIQTKNDKIAQCEMQLVCMEREVGNLTNMLKSNLNNLDESKIAYQDICEYNKCEHDTCLDVQSALSALKTFIDELEECKLERRSRLREIDNLKACVACYSQESVSEITNTDFDTGHATTQLITEDISTSSNYGDSHLSKELVNVQVQSDEVETTTTYSEGSEREQLNEVISYEEIDRALAMHIKRSIDKIHEISTVLQGAGDHHVQIVKEYAKQQQQLHMKDLEITELKQKVAEHKLRRGEGDCKIKEQLRKRMLEREKMLEEVIRERDSEIESLHEDLVALENQISVYRAECDTLKSENADLVNTKSALSKENEQQNEELRAQRDQMCKLIQQTDDLKQTVYILNQETDNIDDMRKKLIDLQMRNNDLTNKLIQANEIISKNAEVITDLKCQDEKNKMALTSGSIRYDAMITQKHSDIVKLQEENQSLRDQLRETEMKFARSNDTIALLKKEDSVVAINVLRTNLSGLDKDKEKLLAKVDYLKNEIANCEDSTASVESKLQTLSRRNESLQADIETVRNTNDQLLRAQEDTIRWHLRDALYTLPGKIYEKIVRIRGESKEINDVTEETLEQTKEVIIPEPENVKKRQQMKIYSDKSCQQDKEFYTKQLTRDELDPVAQAADCNSEDVALRLKFPERQYEEKLQEIKNLMDDVKLRDYDIKNLQECITYLLQEKNDLQNKVKCQAEEYQNKLTLLKRKYDSSLNAFRKRHNENIERLQARFEDIMKIEKSPFDAESWLQSLNLKELTELHNRISILSSHAATDDESDITHDEAKKIHREHQNNPEEHKFYNKFTLHKEHTRAGRLSLNKKANEEESATKTFNIEKPEKTAVTELYSRDLKFKQEHRLFDDDKKHRSAQESAVESPKSRINRTLDWQREKFIYQCSVHHRLNNAR